MQLVKSWFNRMFLFNNPIPCDGVWSSQQTNQLWKRLLQSLYSVLSILFGWNQYAIVGHPPVRDSMPLEVLPDYYLNCDSAKRLWQDWRVLRRLFRRDHSRDLLLQGQSGWLPIHSMIVQQQLVTIMTDEGETVLDLEEPVVWLSRANPANTRFVREPIWSSQVQNNVLWCPA